MTSTTSQLRNATEIETRRDDLVDELDVEALRDRKLFTNFAEAVTSICDAPIANVSLLTHNVQCIVGEVGLELDELERNQTFCTRALADHTFLVVEDALEDDRFRETKYVQGPPHIRFYAGLPIVVDGIGVGTLCAIDREPRSLDIEMRAEMSRLVRLLEAYFGVMLRTTTDHPEREIASELAKTGASTARVRANLPGDSPDSDALDSAERSIERATRALHDLVGIDPAEESLAYQMTEPDSVSREE